MIEPPPQTHCDQSNQPEQVADGEHQITHKVSRILICGSRLKSVVAVRR
jgi:hypothetical protein